MSIPKTAKQTAQATAQMVAKQTMETAKMASGQIAPELSAPQPTEEPQIQDSPQVSPQEEAQIKAQSAQRLAEIEGEMARLRRQREESIAQEKQQQVQAPQAALETSPRKSKGRMGGFFKRLSGKREMQKNVSG